MGGHCSQKLCPGGEGTPLRGPADLRINTRSTTLSQRSATRGLVSQAFSFSPPAAARIWLPPAGHPRLLETSSVGLGLQSPPRTIGGAVPAGPSKWLPPPLPLTPKGSPNDKTGNNGVSDRHPIDVDHKNRTGDTGSTQTAQTVGFACDCTGRWTRPVGCSARRRSK